MKCMCCGKEMRNTIGGCYTCDECGFAINDLVYRGKGSKDFNQDITAIAPEGLSTLSTDVTCIGFGGQGWICPKCGATLSPYTSFCPFCAPKQTNTTTGTSTETLSSEKENEK